jgi:hypothetical protein
MEMDRLPPHERDYMTLEEVALELGDTAPGRAIAARSKTGVIVVRFIREPEEVDLPWDMKLREFRELASRNLARVEISDGSGGQRAKPRFPELV